jgi:hypothetical protein
MSREEATYWHAKARRPHGLRALRVLLEVARGERRDRVRGSPRAPRRSAAHRPSKVPEVTARALRCNTRIELTVDEFLLLDRIPQAGHAVPARLHCELEHEHRGDHVAFAQTGEGVSSNALWWMRWTAAERIVVELPPCLANDPAWPEDQDEDDPMLCWLPGEHRCAHEWQMRSDLEFTRTANSVSELGKQRLRAVPAPAGPQLRIHRDERTIAVHWPDSERWLMIWPPEYPSTSWAGIRPRPPSGAGTCATPTSTTRNGLTRPSRITVTCRG